MARDPSAQLTLAAISFPLVAMAATYAIDTVSEETSGRDRIIVGGVGIASITFGAIGSLLAMYGYATDTYMANSVIATGLGFTLIFILTLQVIMREVVVGMKQKEAVVTLYSVLVIVLTVAFFYQLLI